MYLMELDDPETHDLCLNQFRHSDNMTDVITALRAFSNQSCASRDVVLGEFYNQWKDEPLVVNKWLSIQATSCLPKTLEEVIQLQKHNAFDIKNPNKVRALIGGFCHGNSVRFHQANGNGYVFLAEQIKTLEKLNPQVAARMLTPLTHWKRYDKTRQQLMKQQLEHILSIKDLSKDVYEIASKSML